MATWDFNDEQANLLDVLDMAHTSGPQRIKRGEQRLYVVSERDWLATKTDAADGSVTEPRLPQKIDPSRQRDLPGFIR